MLKQGGQCNVISITQVQLGGDLDQWGSGAGHRKRKMPDTL